MPITGTPLIVGTPTDPDVTESEVLQALNMKGREFESGTILQKIQIAKTIVDSLNRVGATGDIVRVAKLQMAAYLSYLAYCDSPENHLPGTVDPTTGHWTPVDDPEARFNMSSKLAALKRASDESVEAMKNSVAMTTGFAPVFGGLRIK